MSWEYRTGRKKLVSNVCDMDTGEVLETYMEDQYGIVECYYNDEGEIYATTEHFIEPYGETLEELKWSFEGMKEAFDKEVLDLDNIVYAKPY